MKAELNVGLFDSTSGELIADDHALTVARTFFKVLDHRFADSTLDERTLIARVECDYSWEDVCFAIALVLNQDCIAFFTGAFGKLVGPRTEAWGEFNPQYFIRF